MGKAKVASDPDTVCTCAAIRQAARRVTRFYDQALAPFGLRITQYPILASLAIQGASAIGPLAERMVLDRATLGHNLRPLLNGGLVALETGKDRRGRIVSLTPAGRARLAAARPAWETAQADFAAAFGADETKALRTSMHRVARLEIPAAPGSPD